MNSAVIRAALIAAAFTSVGCSSRRELQAVIQNAAGQSIPGAVFYAESYGNAGAFDFTFCVAGNSGEVPPRNSSPLTIAWRPGAKLALAAFAPGKKPIVGYDELGRIPARGNVIALRDLPVTGMKWEPRVTKLSFPFEDNPKLAAKLAGPKYAKLRQTFREAYALIGREALPRELVKRQFLDKLPH